jgi:DNA-binding Lrp family transcriptional regulator
VADLRVLRAMENGIEVVPRPFDHAGEKIGMTGPEVRSNLKDMLDDGTIRSFGAVVDHRSLGLVVNAMVAWDVDNEIIERAGMEFAALPMVSHCYERNRVPGKWRYNIFTMVHGSSEDQLLSFLERGKEITSDADFQVLRSLREFKKVGVRF